MPTVKIMAVGNETQLPETEEVKSPAVDITTRQPLPKLAYSMKETAEVLGVSYFTVSRLISRGLLKSSNALSKKIIPHTEILRFLKATLS